MSPLAFSTAGCSHDPIVTVSPDSQACDTAWQQQQERLTVTRVLRNYLAEFLQQEGPRVSIHVRHKLERLAACHTDLYGGHLWQCGNCGEEHHSYNGCRDRACPACAAASHGPWLELMQSWMLPIDYYQVVFTTPHELNPIIGENLAVCYQLHADAAREALSPRGSPTAWRIRSHRHGDGAAHLGTASAAPRALPCTRPWRRHLARDRPVGDLPRATILSRSHRADGNVSRSLSQKLRRRYRAGKLQLPPELGALADDEQAFRQWLAPLSAKPWVIHCGTREDTFRQDAAFRYLSHYVTGTAISDARILSDEDGQVTIRYKDYRDGRAQNRNHARRRVRGAIRLAHPATALSATALRRLPSATQREAALRLARTALGVPEPQDESANQAATDKFVESARMAPLEDAATDSEVAASGEPMSGGPLLTESATDSTALAVTSPTVDVATNASTELNPSRNTDATPDEDPEADCNRKCPFCGERKLRFVDLLRPRSDGPSTARPYRAPENASTASLRRTTSCRPRPPVHHLDRESRDGTHAHDLRYCAARVLGFFKFTANTVSRSAYAPTALPCSLCSSRDGRKHASNRVHPTGKALAAARDAHPSLVIAV
ncbi:MAG: transposase zinc-binding domain-containing protein [Pirellulaceae bacterium]